MRVGGREVEPDLRRAVEGAVEGLGLRRLQRPEPGRREVARDAGDAGRVGTVRGQRDVDDRVVEPGPACVGDADGRVVRQLHDAVVVVAELELGRRAQHAVRLDAADDALGEGDLLAGDIGPDRREHALHARSRAFGAPHTTWTGPGAGLDHADPEPVGVGMLPRLDDMADHEAGVFGAGVLDALDLEADAGQRVDDLGERGLRVEMVLEPGEGEFHVGVHFLVLATRRTASFSRSSSSSRSRMATASVGDFDQRQRFLAGEGRVPCPCFEVRARLGVVVRPFAGRQQFLESRTRGAASPA